MKIASLLIDNFRGISRLEARDLGDTIIVAGQNGSGKSCIFDAIRLLKSTYGGYQQNEWQNFFGEFAIQLGGDSKHLKGLFNDPLRNAIVEIEFVIREREKGYIAANAAELLEQTIWQSLLPEAFQFGGYRRALFAQQFRERQPEVDARLKAELPYLLAELAQPVVTGRINVSPNGAVQTLPTMLLPVIFSNYRPRQVGVIDFHGAQRHYGRENVQGINLNLEQTNQTYSQHTLYNYSNKYNNVKSEMAGNFIKELLAEKAGADSSEGPAPLTKTLKELFEAFFPEKTFLGPKATIDGSLSFPVRTQSGSEHDLDELSSGEKEILYGYLRIRSSAPRDSIILLDEPELHLNPRLIRGLPDFYRKHLGEALQNQLWLVTHSDALIREAVGKPGFNVYHMLPCGAESTGTSQLKPLLLTEDLEMVLTDLIGDLAAYRPGGKGLIFEGGGDTDFDKQFVGALFSEELRGINLISGTNKTKVKALHEILDRAYQKGDLPTKYYAVVDRDTDASEDGGAVRRFSWDAYHIENYLLDSSVISDVLNSVDLIGTWTSDSVEERLIESARAALSAVLTHKMRVFANSTLVSCISLGFSPKAIDVGKELHDAATRSAARITASLQAELSAPAMAAKQTALTAELEASLTDGTWRKILPGREILKNLVTSQSLPVGYEILRNLIVSKMAVLGLKPAGMRAVVNAIQAD
ncbi:putative ATPase [Caulobacter rhizosphaerae]|jgi:predicted ATPase|uniref:ATPase n=1 Tax=Caulobacter rhizosphaerae TaxID=2010972 RepID=A0ABU1N0U5_9CAUL|nr:AAA family ATPase [Caulobacter rhizosphaerae]MDR6532039.1 putative ATPase [Caulobacter rhizosphaerae]